ncbi:MAG: ligase-associated DNA damage response DEXH box helicase [Parvularcula sp.]
MAPFDLPPPFANWFEGRGWSLRPHQADMLRQAAAGRSALLVAPTGGGKTLAGFLPSLVELAASDQRESGLHTLYLSPLKALATDIARNLEAPVADMRLPIRIETRTGDTPVSQRQRQRHAPPDIMLTTPEQLSLMLAHPSAQGLFKSLRCVIVDEIHALAGKKRGDLLALNLARLWQLAPKMRTVGLSATVAETEPLRRFLVPQGEATPGMAELVLAQPGAAPNVEVMSPSDNIPWAGHSGRHAFEVIYKAISEAKMTLVFTNTRSQAEICFAGLWKLNETGLPIALHHGSLEREQRDKVEAAMVAGKLRAIVCTATLDLGIDWGDVDRVICIGAPKGAARLVQRIGRANHRMDEPSHAMLVPGNRFELLECVAAKEAVDENRLDADPPQDGALDVLCQHIMGMGCAAPFFPDDLYEEVTGAAPYSNLSRADFDDAIDFVATGGYAMRAYEQYRRLVPTPDGRLRVRDDRTAQLYRMNAGTIVELPVYNVRLGRLGGASHRSSRRPVPGKKLGTVEEWFLSQIAPGDTFRFAGEVLRLEGVHDQDAYVSRADGREARVPTWQGAKFPISSFLAGRVRELVSDPDHWSVLPDQVADWLSLQQDQSLVPSSDEMLVETFPWKDRFFLVCYPFDGRIAHQSLGTLLTRRLERAGLEPLGFCPTEYALSIWMRKNPAALDLGALFDEDMLGDDLETWLADAQLMKRTFRQCAVIAGMIQRNHLGTEKTGRQVTFSAGLIYDVLREHQPDHILMRAAWRDAAAGYLDLGRLGALLRRARGRIRHSQLDQVSPLAVPVMLEVGRETMGAAAGEAMLAELEATVLGSPDSE